MPSRSRRGSIIGIWGFRPGEAVRVAYSDESGAGSKEKEPIAVVTAIVINMDEDWSSIESDLSKIRRETPANLLHKGKEFKGQLLYSAVRKNIDKARDVLCRVLAVANPTLIYYGAIDRDGYDTHVERSRAHVAQNVGRDEATERATTTTSLDAAFDNCLARVNRAARGWHEQILWISDHQDSADAKRSRREEQTKTGLAWTRFLASLGHDPVTLKYIKEKEPVRIADTIYFGHSEESLALQLADVCCSTVTLQLLETFYGWRPCVAPFYDLIRLAVVNDGSPPLFRPPHDRMGNPLNP